LKQIDFKRALDMIKFYAPLLAGSEKGNPSQTRLAAGGPNKFLSGTQISRNPPSQLQTRSWPETLEHNLFLKIQIFPF